MHYKLSYTEKFQVSLISYLIPSPDLHILKEASGRQQCLPRALGSLFGEETSEGWDGWWVGAVIPLACVTDSTQRFS